MAGIITGPSVEAQTWPQTQPPAAPANTVELQALQTTALTDGQFFGSIAQGQFGLKYCIGVVDVDGTQGYGKGSRSEVLLKA